MTAGTPGDGMGHEGALASNLMAVIDAVAGLRQAQARAAQAAAPTRPQSSSTRPSPQPGNAKHDPARRQPDLPGTPQPLNSPCP